MTQPPDPIPPTDQQTIVAFWRRCCEALGEPIDQDLPPVEHFGDSSQLADELLDLVVDGPKRATASAVVEYGLEAQATPRVGDRWIVTDGAGTPRVVLETTNVRIGPLSSVDDQFAWDEGEGDRTRAHWLEAHTRFFERYLPTIGASFHPDLPTVFERFRIAYAENQLEGHEHDEPGA